MNKPLRLESLERLGWRFGLDSITILLDELGNPHLGLRCVHVAGSNGKGSTCAFLASMLKRSGAKTGLYTSPHLCDIRERFRVNGLWISSADFQRHSRGVLKACQVVKKKSGHSPTHFEAMTAIAFCWFKEQKVDWVVLEVGLGGRLDATNVIPAPAVALITPISLEHQDILGKSVGKIAREKGGILKSGSLAATVQTQPQAALEIKRAAREEGVPLWLSGRDFRFRKTPNGFDWEGPGLRHRFKTRGLAEAQIPNAALAVAGLQLLKSSGVTSGARLIEKSVSTTRWPGRLEVIHRTPTVLLDGAHNPDAAKFLSSHLRSEYPGKRWIVLNGFLKDKDYRSLIRIMKPLVELSVVTEPASERAEASEKVFRAWGKAGRKAIGIRDLGEALKFSCRRLREKKDMGLLITGSLYLVGACRKLLIGSKGLEKI